MDGTLIHTEKLFHFSSLLLAFLHNFETLFLKTFFLSKILNSFTQQLLRLLSSVLSIHSFPWDISCLFFLLYFLGMRRMVRGEGEIKTKISSFVWCLFPCFASHPLYIYFFFSLRFECYKLLHSSGAELSE